MNAEGKKILIIEDEEGLAVSLKTLIEGQGYNSIVASDAVQGTKFARQETPNLIILDLGLPGGGGFAVLENLNLVDTTSAIPVLVLTANPQKDAEIKACEMGVVDYFHKPFDSAELIKKIKEILGEDNNRTDNGLSGE